MCGPLHVRFQGCGHVMATGQTERCQAGNESQTTCRGPNGPAVVQSYPGVCQACAQTNTNGPPVTSQPSQMQHNASQSRSDLLQNAYAQPSTLEEQEDDSEEDSEEDDGEDEEYESQIHDEQYQQQASSLQSRSPLGQYPRQQHPTQFGGPGANTSISSVLSNTHIPPQAFQPVTSQPQSQRQSSSSRQAWQHSLALEHEQKLARARARAQQAEDRALAHDLKTALAESRLSAQSKEATDVATATAESQALAAAHVHEEETRHVRAAMLASLNDYTSELERRVGRVSKKIRLVFTGCGHSAQRDAAEYTYGEVGSVPPVIHQQGLCDDCHLRQYEGSKAGDRAKRASVHGMSIQGSSSKPKSIPTQYSATDPEGTRSVASGSVIVPRATQSQRPYYEPSESPTQPTRRAKKVPSFDSRAPSVIVEVDEEVNRPETPSLDAQQAALHRENEEAGRQRLFAQAKAAERWRRLHPEDGVTIVSDQSGLQNRARVGDSKARSRRSRK